MAPGTNKQTNFIIVWRYPIILGPWWDLSHKKVDLIKHTSIPAIMFHVLFENFTLSVISSKISIIRDSCSLVKLWILFDLTYKREQKFNLFNKNIRKYNFCLLLSVISFPYTYPVSLTQGYSINSKKPLIQILQFFLQNLT